MWRPDEATVASGSFAGLFGVVLLVCPTDTAQESMPPESEPQLIHPLTSSGLWASF